MSEPIVDAEATAIFESIRPLSLVDEAYRQIREQILAGALRPGAALKDSLLAQQMGISRSPVREALRLLEQSGLVEKFANRSYRISLLAPEDIPELAGLRIADEVLAVRTIVHHRYPIDALDSYIEALQAATTSDSRAAAAADAAFHRAVVDLARMPRLSSRYADLTDQIRLVLLASDIEYWGRGEALVENHSMLVDALRDAIKSGDPRLVVKMWEVHVLGGMMLRDLLEPLN